MIKQLKVYEMEDKFIMPNINYDDWNNPVALELANNGFDFLSRFFLSNNTLYRISDLIENRQEIVDAYKVEFLNKDTKIFINSLLSIYSLSNQLIEFSDIEESEDLIIFSHSKINNENYLCLYILKKILNTILTEKEIIEVIAKELTSFNYNKIASFLLSEDSIFRFSDLIDARSELKHALRYKFLSEKTMQLVSFLNKLSYQNLNNKKDIIFIMDLLKVPV